jgi:hypothetical protein
MLVLLAAACGHRDLRVDPAVEWLVGEQLADGGWNCEYIRRGSSRGSFHMSITVLGALSAYERGGGTVPSHQRWWRAWSPSSITAPSVASNW